MTIEDNKALVNRFVDEFWGGSNESAADTLMAEGVTILVNNDVVNDIDTLKEFARTLRRAFPDWRSRVEEMVAQDDRVAERWTGLGTHKGGFQGIQPTGRQVAVPGTVFYRIVAGKIVEFRGQFDRMSMMEQLGALPQSGHAEVSA
jgi:predicted ester cyclase